MAIAKLSIDLEARFAKLERDLQGFSSRASLLGNNLTSVFTGLAGAIGGAAIVSSFKGIIDGLDRMDEAAERVGISVESLSALDFAGKMNGLELEDMTQALTKLSVKMQEAAAGSKEAGALFKDIGVKVTDSSGKLKSADVVFAEIADRFSKFEDGAGKTALAVDTFGKSGAKLVPVLNGGAAGLEKMRIEAASLGGIISDKLAKQAAEFNDNMDRLSVLSGTVARSIAGELLPSLNKLAERFLVAQSAGLGFWDSLPSADNSTRFKSAGQWIKELTGELDQLTAAREAAMASNKTDGGSIDTGDMEKEIAHLKRRREYFKAIQRMEALEGADANYGNEGRGRTAADGKGAITRTPAGDNKKAAKETAEASAEAIAYGKAMESLAKLTDDAAASQLDLTKSQKTLLELMSAPQWADMPETWKQTAIAQFESAHAAELAADQQKRLNELLGATDAAKIEEAARDMELLAAALEKGVINAEQFTAAAGARLESLGEKAKEATGELDEFAKSAARNMQSSLADFLFDPFAKGTQSMGEQFSNMIRRMMAEAAAAKIAEGLFGGMGKTGSGDWGLLGKGLSSLGSFFNSPASQPTGLASLPSSVLPSFDVGTNYVPRDMVARIHEGESITPKKYNPAAGGAGGALSVVINNNGTPQTVTGQREEVDSRGRRSLVLDMSDAMAGEAQRSGSRLNRALSAPRMISR